MTNDDPLPGVKPTPATVAMNCLRRVVFGNFQREKATDHEREVLKGSTPPVHDPIAQDYAAWRRALLYFGAAALIVWSVIELATYETSLEKADAAIAKIEDPAQRQQAQARQKAIVTAVGEDNFDLIDSVFLIIKLAVIIGTIFLVLAAREWNHLKKSRRWARLSFGIIFLTPFVMAAIPFTALMEFPGLAAQAKKEAVLFLGLDLGFSIFLVVGPRALALYPAVIRSSVTLKTLIPESPLAGWAATIMGSFYPIFLIVVVATINQMGGSGLLLIGLVCLIIAPMIYLFRAREIMQPHSPEQVQDVVLGIRRKAVVFNLVGIVLLAVFVLRLDFFHFGDFLRFSAGFLGNFMLVTLVGSDLMLALMHAGHAQTSKFEGTELARNLDAKFDGLRGVGLLDIKTTRDDSPAEQP